MWGVRLVVFVSHAVRWTVVSRASLKINTRPKSLSLLVVFTLTEGRGLVEHVVNSGDCG